MATLQHNINQAISDFYDIKIALQNANMGAETPTSEYAEKISMMINNYDYNRTSQENAFITVQNNTRQLLDCNIYGNIAPSWSAGEHIDDNSFVGNQFSSPVKYKIPISLMGKNLLQNQLSNITIDGVSVQVNDDGSITLNNTASADINLEINNSFPLDVSKQYKIIYNGDLLPSGTCLSVRQSGSNKVIANVLNTNTAKKKTFSNVNKDLSGFFFCYLSISEGTSFDNYTFKPMVTLVENDNNYEPYKHSEIEIDINEPLRRIQNISDYYNVHTNKVFRRIQKITIDTSNFSNIYFSEDGNSIGTYYAVSGQRYYTDDDIATNTVTNHLIVDNLDVEDNNSNITIQWESPTSSNLNILAKIAFLDNYTGDTIMDKFYNYFINNPITVWYCLSTAQEENAISSPVNLIMPTMNQYNSLYVSTLIPPSKLWVKYFRKSELSDAVGNIENVLITNGINISPYKVEDYSTLINSYLQTVIPKTTLRALINKTITKITIPDGTTKIGGYAFYSCKQLETVNLPNSITSIEVYGFHTCSSLTNITIPNSVTSIGAWAFNDCGSLTSIEIPNSVTNIGMGAFYGCQNLTNVTISNNVTRMENYTFYQCRSLTNVTIPNSVTSIGKSVFYDCSNLTSVTIPNSVTSVESDAFLRCINLENVTFEEDFQCSGLDLSGSTKFSVDTMIAMFNALADKTGQTACTLKLGSTNLAKLSNEQLAVATQKNWILV